MIASFGIKPGGSLKLKKEQHTHAERY